MTTNADVAIRQSLGIPAGNPQVTPAPAPAAPAAGAPAAVDPKLLGELQAQNQALANQVSQLTSNLNSLMGEIENRKQAAEEVKLPTDDELDALPRNEAIKRVAEAKAIEAINSRLMPGLRKMAGDLLQVKAFADEETLRQTYPKLDVKKYSGALAERRASAPGMSALDAIRLIADPNELIASLPTPQSQEAVHMEARGRSGGFANTQQQQNGPTEAELRKGFTDARASGNKLLADRYLTAIMSRRPDVPATGRK